MTITIKTEQCDMIEIYNVCEIADKIINNNRILICHGEYVDTDRVFALSVRINGCLVSQYNHDFVIAMKTCKYIKIE